MSTTLHALPTTDHRATVLDSVSSITDMTSSRVDDLPGPYGTWTRASSGVHPTKRDPTTGRQPGLGGRHV